MVDATFGVGVDAVGLTAARDEVLGAGVSLGVTVGVGATAPPPGLFVAAPAEVRVDDSSLSISTVNLFISAELIES